MQKRVGTSRTVVRMGQCDELVTRQGRCGRESEQREHPSIGLDTIFRNSPDERAHLGGVEREPKPSLVVAKELECEIERTVVDVLRDVRETLWHRRAQILSVTSQKAASCTRDMSWARSTA